jgi:bacillithiol system protein YtxJ
VGLLFRKDRNKKLPWQPINSIEELMLTFGNNERPRLYFKHSTRCVISSMALKAFENRWDASNKCDIYFIDLLRHRGVSNKIAEELNVKHESPQVILVVNNEVVHHASHSSISANAILDKI